MDQHHLARETLECLGCGIAEIAEPEKMLWRDAVGMGRHMPIEDMDVAAGKPLAQMIVTAAIPEPKFHDRPARGARLHGSPVETAAQRLQAPDRAIQPARGGGTH